ncbi:MAG: outer membrane beta-barrel protein/hypothetical protein TREAZ_3533 [Treponematales bacterium]
MKRRGVLLVFLVLALGSRASGLDFAGGGGVTVSGLMTRYSLDVDGTVSTKITQDIDQVNCGVSAFLDAVWGEAVVALQTGANWYRERLFDGGMEESGTGRETAFSLSLLGKRPFALRPGVTVFPLVGVEYLVVLGEWRSPEGGASYDRTDGRETDKDGKALRLSDWNALFVRVGGGADYAVNDALFLRGEALYGIRLMTGYESKNLEMTKQRFGDDSPESGGLSSGLTLRISLGYRPRRGGSG